jgi:hypothetical protein
LTALLAATATLFAATVTFFPMFLAALLTAFKALGNSVLFRVLNAAILGWVMDNAFTDIVFSIVVW